MNKNWQQIIDHWHVGKIKQQRRFDSYVLINTERGDFALVTTEDPMEINQARSDLMASNLRAEALTRPKQAHVAGRHYQLWRLSVLPENQRFRVRPAREADYSAIEALALRLHALDQKALPEILKANPKYITSRGTYLNVLDDRNAAFFVADRADQIVGFVYGWVEKEDDDLHKPETVANIGELYVLPPHRRIGVATALLTKLIEWARRHRATRLITISYSYATAAQALYAKLGLEPRSIKLERKLKQNHHGS